MSGAQAPFSAKRVEGTVIRPIGDKAAIITYNAIHDHDGVEMTVAATTVYAYGLDGWKGILYQQTPLQGQ